MKVKSNCKVVLIRSCGINAGKTALVLWEEGFDPLLGALWRVRFKSPEIVFPFSTATGKVVRKSLAVSNEAVVPQGWMMVIDSPEQSSLGEMDQIDSCVQDRCVLLPVDVDFSPLKETVTPIEAELSWPDGWLDASSVPSEDVRPASE